MAKSLKTLRAKPKLVKLVLSNISSKEIIDDKEVITTDDYEFFVWDRQPMEVFMELATLAPNGEKSEGLKQDETMKVLVKLILDENGDPIITDGFTLPTDVLAAAVVKLMDLLGN